MADLTYGDVFKLFPRMNNVTTPELNRRIIIPRHLRPVTAADRFWVQLKHKRRVYLFWTRTWVQLKHKKKAYLFWTKTWVQLKHKKKAYLFWIRT